MRAVRLIREARVPGWREWRRAEWLFTDFLDAFTLDAVVLEERVVVSTREYPGIGATTSSAASMPASQRESLEGDERETAALICLL